MPVLTGYTNAHDLLTLPAWRPFEKGAEAAPGAPPLWGLSGGFEAPPAVGARVDVRINGFGPATVLGYFVEHGFLGVKVKPDVRPPWHVRQNPSRDVALVFGAEIAPEPAGEGVVWTRAAADAAAWRKRRGRGAAITDRIITQQFHEAIGGASRLMPTADAPLPTRDLARVLYTRAFRVHAYVNP
jgi:hypothetical protein